MSAIRSILRTIHAAVPETVRRPLDIATVNILDTYDNWRLPTYRIRAPLVDDGIEATVVFFGDQPQYGAWIQALFGRAIEPQHLGEVSLLRVLQHGGKTLRADIKLCPVNPLMAPIFVRRGWKIVPKFVNCLVDLRRPIKSIFGGKGIKRELTRLKNKEYIFDILNSDAAFEEFYTTMLVPTVSKRFGELAHISSLSAMKKIMEKGFLLAAFLDSRWVGANLMVPESQTVLRSANLGWRDGDEKLLKEGVIAAMYAELIVYAKDHGFEYLDLGSCDPFPNDGVLNYKLKWEANLAMPRVEYRGGEVLGVRGFLALRVDLSTPAGAAMLRQTPVFEKHQNSLRVIGWKAEILKQFRHQVEGGIPWIDLSQQ